MLLSFIVFVLYLSCEKNKNKQKRGRAGPIKIKIWKQKMCFTVIRLSDTLSIYLLDMVITQMRSYKKVNKNERSGGLVDAVKHEFTLTFLMWYTGSPTELGDLLDFGQLFTAFGIN